MQPLFCHQVLEPRFTAESLATLLSIPIGKKLLRRHLATHFDSLVGQACMKVKEKALADGASPLLPGEKHKVVSHCFIECKNAWSGVFSVTNYAVFTNCTLCLALDGLYFKSVFCVRACSPWRCTRCPARIEGFPRSELFSKP